MFASFGIAIAKTSLTFVSKYDVKAGIPEKLKLKKTAVAVSNTRNISKASMKLNDALSRMEVNPETYEVPAYGELLICEPATVLPIDQRYFLF
jgi:urease subunit alpha